MGMKIAIGTAQLGFNYGVANINGKIEKLEAKDILQYAIKYGVDTIDTAIAYGESEKCLGEIGVDRFKIVTKLPEVPSNYGDLKKWIDNHLKNYDVH